MIPVFVPRLAQPSTNVGLTVEKTVRFPWYDHPFGGALASGRSETGAQFDLSLSLLVGHSWKGCSMLGLRGLGLSGGLLRQYAIQRGAAVWPQVMGWHCKSAGVVRGWLLASTVSERPGVELIITCTAVRGSISQGDSHKLPGVHDSKRFPRVCTL
eukprot:3002090-Amphidinium_carterae.1